MPRYLAFRYRQTPEAKPILAFVAPALDIRSFAGVPHKTTDFIGGFQRPLSDRFKQIISFFDEAGNSSPTSIVVSLRPGTCTITPLALPKGLNAEGLTYKPEWVLLDIAEPNLKRPTTELAADVYALVRGRVLDDAELGGATSGE